MRGLLTDVNVQGYLRYLKRLMKDQGLLELLTEFDISLATFPDLGLDRGTDDRTLWRYCQDNGWVLFTDNRNHDGVDSLEATLRDSWREGCLPVLTLVDKGRFERDPTHAARVADSVAEWLCKVFVDGIRDRRRIYVPN